MIPTIRYLLPVLFFVMNAAVFADDKCISVENSDSKADPPSEWVSVGNEWMTVNGKKIKLRVRKNAHETDSKGNPLVKFVKTDDDNVWIDSTIFFDGSYSVMELNNITNITKEKKSNGVVWHMVYNKKNELVGEYITGLKEDDLFGPNGEFDPKQYSTYEIRGDTIFLTRRKDAGGWID